MKRMPVILIVDDNEQDRKIMLRLLRRLGWNDPLEAGTRETGEQLAAQHPIDLAIVDTVLPGAEGFDVCRAIRRLKPASKIIMITGQIAALDAGKARKAGADDYVVKTSDGEPLAEALRQAMKEFV